MGLCSALDAGPSDRAAPAAASGAGSAPFAARGSGARGSPLPGCRPHLQGFGKAALGGLWSLSPGRLCPQHAQGTAHRLRS